MGKSNLGPVSLIARYFRDGGEAGDNAVTGTGLDPARVAQFNAIIQAVAPGAAPLDAQLIAALARQLGNDRGAALASVVRRVDEADDLRTMADDPAWRLPVEEVERVGTVMRYLDRCDDLIPDDTPKIGLLDDAILIEIAQRSMQREIDDYEDFRRFRRAEAQARGVGEDSLGIERRDWLAWRRLLLARDARPGRSFTPHAQSTGFRIR
jgi:hypothetical protein